MTVEKLIKRLECLPKSTKVYFPQHNPFIWDWEYTEVEFVHTKDDMIILYDENDLPK